MAVASYPDTIGVGHTDLNRLVNGGFGVSGELLKVSVVSLFWIPNDWERRVIDDGISASSTKR